MRELDTLYANGVRVFDFTHADNNDFADSSRSGIVEHGGLLPLGRPAIGRLNGLGILIDVSQLSADAALQAVRLSRAPVVASHSAVKALADTPRNLGDAELEAIKAGGGVVQIPAPAKYLTSQPEDYLDRVAELRAGFGLSEDGPVDVVFRGYETLDEARMGPFFSQLQALWPGGDLQTLADHIDYAVQRIGIDHVGIGNDFNHGGGVEGFADLGEAGSVTRELVSRGYSEADIA